MTAADPDDIEVTRGARTIVLVPDLPRGRHAAPIRRDRDGRLDEAEGLALAIGLQVLARRSVPVRRPSPATLLGKGQVDDIGGLITDEKIQLVVVDAALTPVQQRNLETAWSCKVIDRTALILEIFGERAATAEGRLQVELAHLDYQVGRLVRSWTHLERQRGGFGFLGGPGETQIEADRRLIRDRMARLRRQLDDVRRTRGLHRERRRRAPWPVVALVGYTNAGKSTLFNILTKSDVMAEDILFATLDPTMRQIDVPGVGKVIIADTVGFVSDLPTQLVAAFRATLEEVEGADLLLHVRDISHPDTEAQRADVIDVLAGLGIGEGEGPPILEIYNKIDLLDADRRADILTFADRDADRGSAVAVSALDGSGLAGLHGRLVDALGGTAVERTLIIPVGDGARHSWIHRHAQIISREATDAELIYQVTLSFADSARFDKLPG